jgi:hypothetical protein
MDNQEKTKGKSKKAPTRPELKPISYEEIMGNAGMSGFVSFLDAGEPEGRVRGATEAPGASKPDQKAITVQIQDTVEDTHTVQQSKASASTVQQSKAVQEAYTVPDRLERPWRRSHIKRTHAVEDGHSLAEQEVYRALWRTGEPEGDDPAGSRMVRIGYDRLANLVRLSWVTVKANLRSLEKKLSIEVVAAEDSANREGKQYRVYSNAAIWARRESAGLLWVRRTRGVELLTNAGDAPAPEPTTEPPIFHRT